MAKKVSPSKIGLQIIYYIDDDIASGAYPNTPELAKKYKKSIPTISRYIEWMRDSMRAPIKSGQCPHDPKKKGYYYTDERFRLTPAYATAEDLLAVELVKELMKQYQGTPIHDKVNELLKMISAPINSEKDSKWYKDRIIIHNTVTVPVDPVVWQNIFTGLKENRVISFDYLTVDKRASNKIGNKQKTRLSFRTVRPYQLLFNRNMWTLLGYDVEAGRVFNYFVSRISNLSLSKRTFKFNKDLLRSKTSTDAFFSIVPGKTVYNFAIEFFGDIRWINERQIAEDKEIKETDNGVIITFTSTQIRKVFAWLISFGYTARPLEPKILVDKWKEAVKEMNKLAKL